MRNGCQQFPTVKCAQTGRFEPKSGPFEHILASTRGEIRCAAEDLALFRKTYLGSFFGALGNVEEKRPCAGRRFRGVV